MHFRVEKSSLTLEIRMLSVSFTALSSFATVETLLSKNRMLRACKTHTHTHANTVRLAHAVDFVTLLKSLAVVWLAHTTADDIDAHFASEYHC